MTYMPTGRSLVDPFLALELSGIKEGMKVADLGVGAVGHFLFSSAKMVGPKGTVYGIDILKTVLEANESRARIEGFRNVELVWGDIDRIGGTGLPERSMDMAIVSNVLHLGKDGGLLEEAHRILHSGGILLIVEWKAAGTTPGMGPAPEKRVTKEEAKEILVRYGFVLKKEFEAGPNHYGLVAEKPMA